MFRGTIYQTSFSRAVDMGTIAACKTLEDSSSDGTQERNLACRLVDEACVALHSVLPSRMSDAIETEMGVETSVAACQIQCKFLRWIYAFQRHERSIRTQTCW